MAFSLKLYTTYDVTNLATVKHWPVVTVVDMTGGAVLSVLVSYAGFMAGKWLS